MSHGEQFIPVLVTLKGVTTGVVSGSLSSNSDDATSLDEDEDDEERLPPRLPTHPIQDPIGYESVESDRHGR
ncbi:hypothetical protein OUZ56_012743 [Daphnia magna]|uniref:Uncharacterized protein n=1 Tax=Daphnia magna TaxID=35525 RepID=A0ABQ9Z3X5_9CRUS|nr:hypothetical protein OUZ56_012743 [Daphnia magna]